MGTTRPHWSYSAISQYLRCPLQYYFERVLRLPQLRVTSELVLGSAVHEALAHYHRKLQQGREIEPNSLKLVFEQAWRAKELRQGLVFKRGQTRESQLALGNELLATYLKYPPPENIVAVERTFLVPLKNSQGEYLETPLMAVVDLMTECERTLQIHEFKTAGRAFSQSQIDSSLQATCYSQAVTEEFGRSAQVEFAVLVKTKVPRFQQITTNRTETERRRLGDLVTVVEQAVNDKIFYPIESPLNCSGCPYRSPCREWKAPRSTDQLGIHQLNGTGTC